MSVDGLSNTFTPITLSGLTLTDSLNTTYIPYTGASYPININNQDITNINALNSTTGTISTINSTTGTISTINSTTLQSKNGTIGYFGLIALISILGGVPGQPFITLSLSVTPPGFMAGSSVTFVGITGTASIMNGIFTINSISSPGNFFLASNPGLAVGYYNPGANAYVYLTDSGTLTGVNGSFVGSLTAPTMVTSDNSINVATTEFIKTLAYAPLASPALTGTPTAPTASPGTNTTQLATTAFVVTAIGSAGPFLRSTAITTGVNAVMQLSASGIFSVQSSTGVPYFVINGALSNPYVATYGLSSATYMTITNTSGIQIPALGVNGGDGTRYVLLQGSTGTYPCALGIYTSQMWAGVPIGYSHGWYVGPNSVMKLDSVGNLLLTNGYLQVSNLGLTGNTWATITGSLTSWTVNGNYSTFTSVAGNAASGLGIGVDTAGNPWMLALQPSTAWRTYNAVASSYAFYTSNSASTGLFMLNSGYVGISTASPSAQLNIGGSSGNRLTSFAITTPQAGIYMASSATGGGSFNIWVTTTASDYISGALVFYNTATSMFNMVIDSAGYMAVGNGATLTTQLNALTVYGGNNVSGISLGDYTTTAQKYIGITVQNNGTSINGSVGFSGMIFGPPNNAGTSGYLSFCTHQYGVQSGERMRIDKLGNVGIGTASPGNPLHVYGAGGGTAMVNVQTTVTTGTVGFQHTNGVTTMLSYVGSGVASWGTSTNHPIQFYTNNNNAQFVIYPGSWNNLICPNTVNTVTPSDWQGGTLFTQVATSGTRSVGLMVGYSSTFGAGYIISLQPAVAWQNLQISASTTYLNCNGSLCAYTNSGGWVNVSDRREKTNIKSLKTNRSLERVLACKTVTYNRVFYKDSSGNDLVSDDIKATPHIGLLAQDQLETNPHCVSSWENEQKEERYGLQYNDYVVHLIGAVQEQQRQIDELKELVKTLLKKL